MIRNTNGSGRRILTSPAILPCENIALSTLLSSLIALSDAVSTFQRKSFPCNNRNARNAIRLTLLLQPFLHEIRDNNSGLSDPATLSLSELHFTFQKLLFLLEDLAREGAKLYLLMESDRVASQFRVISRSVATSLDVFPFGSVDISDETKEHVLLLNEQARRARFEFEEEDKRVVMSVVSGLTRFENRVAPDEGELKWVLEYIGVRGWSECNKEVKFLEGEIGFESLNEEKRKVGFLSSLMGFMSYCRCVVMEVVDCEESKRKNDASEKSPSFCFVNSDDFRCPISLELMSDPVTIETGHSYDRSSILKWFRSGNATCPKTGRRLNSTELVPNLVLRRLIQQYCYANGIDTSIPIVRNRDITRTMEPGSVAAEGAMRMLASFLKERIENGSGEEKNRSAFEIRLLSKASIFSRSCLVEAGLVPLLLKLLSLKDSLTQENAAAALLNLSKCAKSRSMMVEKWGLELIVGVLKDGVKIEARQHAAAVLFYLASSAEYGNLIGLEPEAIPSLIRLVKGGSDRSKKNGLVAIFGLLKHPKNHTRVLQSGVVPLLVEILKECEKEDIITDSLAILATLAEKSSEGVSTILHCGAMHVGVEILSCSTSRLGKEHCVALLLSLAINGGEDVVACLVKNASLMGSLYSQLSEGTSRASKKASALIRVLHDFYERRSSGFKASVIPQEQFIHVW
ncbi:U-box domain-containing protein 19 [Cajanus cajan]|uniref:RING-type E3 ubiquitin transferase n=1 Tax=Cajanus cajan TaxID=3821 RepID=A0A151TGI8_CAJCA|nr:U-box domain-containing protein 19 [Cajanus cajan]KYP66170.1 U-box domain-containing protein 19 [Cajanus cajan]